MAKEMLIRPHDKVLFIGDSITDAGRRDAAWAPLGRGYVYFVASWLRAKYPEMELHFENRGIGGNTVLDLQARWQQDAIAEKPDVLSCLIGINDAMRVYRRGARHEELGVSNYEKNYSELLQRAKEQCNCRFVLWEPFLITHDYGSKAMTILKDYIEAVHRLAEKYNAVLIRTQQIFEEACKKRSPEYWAGDSVHPTPQGHALMAQAFIEAIGA